MKNNFLLTILMSFVCLAWLSCSPAVTPSNGTDEDVPCEGDGCAAEVDAEQVDVVDEELPPDPIDVKTEDEKPEDVPCTNFCELGEIKCDGDDAYKVCEEDDEGCRGWWSTKTQCSGDFEICACAHPDIDAEVCEVLDEEDYCVCVPQCDGKVCGADGCGGSCGECGENETCVVDQTSCELCNCDDVLPCLLGETICNGPLVQKCANIWQDSDVCEGECWTFGEAEECPNEGQLCEADECACEFEKCEDECCETVEHVCSVDGCCLADCTDKECGPDGCGGSCGECEGEDFCNEGKCDADCPAASENCEGEIKCTEAGGGYFQCVPVSENCPDKLKWSDEAYACEGDNEECVSGKCECIPDCAEKDKDCGSDGCGGSCGDCPQGLTCCEQSDIDEGGCATAEENTCTCVCPGNPSPACDKFSNKEYASACEAECDGLVASADPTVCDEGEYCKGACPTCESECTEEELESGPMCGEGMISYASFCALKCDIGDGGCTAVGDCDQIEYAGECKLDYCTGCENLGYDPVCDVDSGTTYNNKCDMALCAPDCNAEGCEPPENICFGECPTADCDCPDSCEPVCGKLSDTFTRTYMNECMLECAGAEYLEDGPCCPQCAQEAEAWICSVDATGEVHKSYKNECVMGCKDATVDKLYDIPKASDGSYMVFLCEGCPTVDLSGVGTNVCGDDFEDYFNMDALNCASDFTGSAVEPYDPTLCDEGADCFSADCPCSPSTEGLIINSDMTEDPNDSGQRGVCGEDGNTYANKCHAAFYGVDVDSIKWCSTCPTDGLCAGMQYSPYCCFPAGVETGWGVTYPNPCIAEKCNSNVDFPGCQKGKCCLEDEDCDDGNPDTTDTCNLVCENL